MPYEAGRGRKGISRSEIIQTAITKRIVIAKKIIGALVNVVLNIAASCVDRSLR